MKGRPWLAALSIDAAAIVVFVTGGRETHEETDGVLDALGVAAPFFIGLLVGAALIALGRIWALSLWGGLVSAASTVVVGMLLRHFAWDRGTATSFIVVASLVLGVAMLGWRALWAMTTRRRERVA